MLRSFAILMVFATSVHSAPLPKDLAKPLYHPIQVGAKRVLEYSSGNPGVASQETTETVTKVEQKDGKYLVTVSLERKGANVAANPTSVLSVSEKGVSRVRTQDRDLAEPFILLQFPAKAGDSWKANGRTYQVGKEEVVEVPAGKFRAIPITTDQGNPQLSITTTSWYAPKVGLVKTVMNLNGTDRTTVLKSFTPGK